MKIRLGDEENSAMVKLRLGDDCVFVFICDFDFLQLLIDWIVFEWENYQERKALKVPKHVCCIWAFNIVMETLQGFTILSIVALSFNKVISMNGKAYRALKNHDKDATDEARCGGYALDIQNIQEGLELLKTIISKSNLEGKIFIGIDATASEFYAIETYIT